MLEKILAPILIIIRHKKKHVLLTFLSALLITIIIFPFDDLSDLITQQIAKNTNSQVFMQFDHLGVGLLPPSIKMLNVSVDTPFLPTIKAEQLNLAPSILGLLKFSPGFQAHIYGFLGGDINLSYVAGKKISDQVQLQNIDLDFSKVDLNSLSKFAGVQVNLNGKINTDIQLAIDPNFIEQPDGQIQINIKDFNMPQSTIPTMMGPLGIPEVKLSKVLIKGAIKNSNFTIESSEIGAAGDTIIGKITGRVGVRMQRLGNTAKPDFSNYELQVDLTFDRNLDKNIGALLSLINIDKYKTNTSTGSRYAFNISAPNFMSIPSISPYSTK